MTKKKSIYEMTPEEERAYWDAQDPLRQGKPVKIQRIERPQDGLSLYTFRISAKDITRLARAAKSRGMNSSEMARKLILEALDRLESQPTLEERVESLERDVQDLRRIQSA